MVMNGLPPIHPGQFLREILEELAVSQARFARTIDVAPMRISHVVKGVRPVTAELALLFGRALGQSPQNWLNLQAAHDLKLAERAVGSRLRAVAELAKSWVARRDRGITSVVCRRGDRMKHRLISSHTDEVIQ